MKNTFLRILFIALFILTTSFTSERESNINIDENCVRPTTMATVLSLEESLKLNSKNNFNKVPFIGNQYIGFREAVGFKESRSRYHIVNTFGYMGKYQFGRKTLRGLGFKMSKEEFLNSPSLQEQAMYALLKQNKRSLRKYIAKYDGKYIHGILVTESGLLAAAHLGGAGSVKKWFRTGKVRKDGNGVKITSYMERFGGYDLNV